jgi:hypothetical protein
MALRLMECDEYWIAETCVLKTDGTFCATVDWST